MLRNYNVWAAIHRVMQLAHVNGPSLWTQKDVQGTDFREMITAQLGRDRTIPVRPRRIVVLPTAASIAHPRYFRRAPLIATLR